VAERLCIGLQLALSFFKRKKVLSCPKERSLGARLAGNIYALLKNSATYSGTADRKRLAEDREFKSRPPLCHNGSYLTPLRLNIATEAKD